MNGETTGPASGIQEINNCLIVPVGSHLDEDGLEQMGKAILARLASAHVRGVLINVSDIAILGSYGFSILKKTARAITMMGTPAVFVGFQPGVAAALVNLDTDFKGILTAVTPEDAFGMLKPQSSPAPAHKNGKKT